MNGRRYVNSDWVENFDDSLIPSVPSPPAGSCLCADSKLRTARPICFRLFAHADRRAASRGLHGGEQQGHQHADDRDDHQEFDERKTTGGEGRGERESGRRTPRDRSSADQRCGIRESCNSHGRWWTATHGYLPLSQETRYAGGGGWMVDGLRRHIRHPRIEKNTSFCCVRFRQAYAARPTKPAANTASVEGSGTPTVTKRLPEPVM